MVGLLLVCTLAVRFGRGMHLTAAQTARDSKGFDLSNLDRTCKPCEDFNRFANGGWIAKNPIPAAYPRWGNFNVLGEKNRDKLREILEEAAKDTSPAPGSNWQKVGSFYAACMNESKINRLGVEPLKAEFARINAVKDQSTLQTEVARLQQRSINVMFGVGSEQDFKNSSQVIGGFAQGGLGLPDRDYYTKTDDKSKEIREQYQQHVAKMFELLGDASGKSNEEAATVMKIETSLASASMTRVEQRDPNAIYHKMNSAQLKELAPNFSWEGYAQNIGLSSLGDVNVGQPEFFRALNGLLTTVSLDDWKTYLRWHLLNSMASALSQNFVDEDFRFNGTVLTGTKENLPRWKRCVATTDRELGEALGQVFVEKTFSPEAKERAREMVKNLEEALREDISTLDWMSEATKEQAQKKLAAFINKIGYPDKWRDYSRLQIARESYVENLSKSNEFEFARDLGKIGKPVDRTEWGMSPPTVNAYYNPLMNEIVFPAGILQPPFFDPNADDAINYGGMGAVIGHEISHGFDDEGRRFDAAGNLSEWWTSDDLKKFTARADCVIKQFDSYVVEGDIHQNGKLVVGESIADLGGLAIAYKALQKSLKNKPAPHEIDGFTPEQRFFLGWAQIWAGNDRPEFARLLANVDPHPLGKFRVNGPLSNLPAFAAAFSCKMGDPMIRTGGDRCQIW